MQILITGTLTPSIDQDIPNPQMKTKRTEEILSPNKTLPWQQLLVAPPQQVIIVERMHSGARRFVTLDFGQPVLLTDIMIPASHDLVSISIDLWLKNEEADGLRLVVSSDIGSRDLILSDLQPPPLCRYMKVIFIFTVTIIWILYMYFFSDYYSRKIRNVNNEMSYTYRKFLRTLNSAT